MGSFLGHVLPGIVLLLHGLWWILASQWLRSIIGLHQRVKSKSFCEATNCKFCEERSKSYIPFPLCPRIPIEPMLKIVIPLIGIMDEVLLRNKADPLKGKNRLVFQPWSLHKENGSFSAPLDKLDHITLYLGFILSGVVDLLVLVCHKNQKVKAQLFLSLAYMIEGFLIYFHAEGRNSLDAILHKLLMCAVLASLLFSILRVFHPLNITVNSCLGLSIALQGTWLIQIGDVLYGKKYWDRGSEGNVEFVINCFMWHIILLAFSTFAVHCVFMVGCHKYIARKTHEKETPEVQSLIDSAEL